MSTASAPPSRAARLAADLNYEFGKMCKARTVHPGNREMDKVFPSAPFAVNERDEIVLPQHNVQELIDAFRLGRS